MLTPCSGIQTGRWEPFFSVGIYLNGIAKVGLALMITAFKAAYRAGGIKVSKKINLSRKICFFVFPNV